MNLTKAEIGLEYTISDLNTTDEDMKDFLYSLGCFTGEHVTIMSKLACNYVISIKGARYSIDDNLAKAIELK